MEPQERSPAVTIEDNLFARVYNAGVACLPIHAGAVHDHAAVVKIDEDHDDYDSTEMKSISFNTTLAERVSLQQFLSRPV